MAKKEIEELVKKIRNLFEVTNSYQCPRAQYDQLLSYFFNKNEWKYYKDQFHMRDAQGKVMRDAEGELKIVKVLKYDGIK